METQATEVLDHIKGVISKILSLPPNRIDDAQPLTDYGLNSIDLIDLVASLETEYGIQFDPATMENITCRSLSTNVISSLRAG
jgi:acyl carrier protein